MEVYFQYTDISPSRPVSLIMSMQCGTGRSIARRLKDACHQQQVSDRIDIEPPH